MTEIEKLLTVMPISLSQGLYALVDGEDYEQLSKHKWSAGKVHNVYYASRTNVIGKRRKILMHREIMKEPVGFQIDHINGDGLDNRKANLRICTHSQNHQNQFSRKGCTSCFKGVSRRSNCNKWEAGIKHKGKSIWLGNYNTEIEAAKAYDKKAKELFGNFARINDVE